MWTRHASRSAAENSRLGVVIQVSATFSAMHPTTRAHVENGRSLCARTTNCTSRTEREGNRTAASGRPICSVFAGRSEIRRWTDSAGVLTDYGRGVPAGPTIPLILARGLTRSTRIGSRVTTSLHVPGRVACGHLQVDLAAAAPPARARRTTRCSPAVASWGALPVAGCTPSSAGRDRLPRAGRLVAPLDRDRVVAEVLVGRLPLDDERVRARSGRRPAGRGRVAAASRRPPRGGPGRRPPTGSRSLSPAPLTGTTRKP